MDFNLDLSKYSVRDLQAMFKLGECYTASELDEKETLIRSQLVTKGMNDSLKGNLTRFLLDAKGLLQKEISGNGMIPTPPIYIPAKLEEYVAGSVNPYERRTQTKCVCVDSVFRVGLFKESGVEVPQELATDFMYTLPESIKNAVSMRLAAIEMPEVFAFSVRNNSNIFRLKVKNGPNGDETFTITLAEGNYAVGEMSQLMQEALSSVPYVVVIVTAQRTTIRLRAIDSTISVFNPESPNYAPLTQVDVEFGIEGKNLAATAGWTLGFRRATYTTPAVSETPYAPPSYVFLDVDDFHNNFQPDSVISTNGLSYLGNTLLARVGLGQYRSDISQKRDYFGPVRLDKLHFRLLTRFGEVADLGGADFSFVLEFTTIYS